MSNFGRRFQDGNLPTNGIRTFGRSNDRNSRRSVPSGHDENSRWSIERPKDDRRSGYSQYGGLRGRDRSPRASEPMREIRNSAPPPCGSRNRESVGRRRSSYRVIGSIIPPIPEHNLEELDPDEINEHFEEAIDFNFSSKSTLQDQKIFLGSVHGIDAKVFSVRQHNLTSKEDGYLIEIRHVCKDGTLFCTFDDPRSKAVAKELQNDLTLYYGRSPKTTEVAIGNLRVGEIVVAKVKPLNSNGINSGIFIRGSVKSIDLKNETVYVLNLDDFGIHTVTVNDISRINRYFVDHEANMLCCKIDGLEFFSGTEIIHRVFEECPLPKPMCYILYFSVQNRGEGKIPMVDITRLMDTYTDNIGKYVLTNLKAAVSPLNSLMEDKQECKIVHCNSRGMLWLRFISDNVLWDRVYSALQEFSEKLSRFCKITPLSVKNIQETDAGSKSIVYIINFHVQESGNKEIRRVTIEESYVDKNKVKVLFIDYGGTQIVSASSICPLKICEEVLCFIPHMAVKVRLEVIKFMKANLLDIQSIVRAPFAIAKVVDEWPGGYLPPEVRVLFSKNQPNVETEKENDVNYKDEIEYSTKTLSDLLIETEEESDDDNYKHEGIAYSSKTLSGLLMKKKLAIPLNQQDKLKIVAEKLRVSHEMSKQRLFSFSAN